LDNCILAGGAGAPIWCEEIYELDLTCCDVFGNTGGNYVGCIAPLSGINNNIEVDPMFCNPQAWDLTLCEDSPCADDPVCAQIGASPVGCGPCIPTPLPLPQEIDPAYKRRDFRFFGREL
jgi:hypothetical protein